MGAVFSHFQLFRILFRTEKHFSVLHVQVTSKRWWCGICFLIDDGNNLKVKMLFFFLQLTITIEICTEILEIKTRTNISYKLPARNKLTRRERDSFIQEKNIGKSIFWTFILWSLFAKSSFTASSNSPFPGGIGFKSLYVAENKISQRL